MKLTINSDGGLEDINWSETRPQLSPFNESSKTSTRIASGNFGKFLFHRLKGKGYTIAHHDYSTGIDADVILESPYPFLGLQLQYKNNLIFTLKGLGEINLRESYFHLSYVPDIYFSTALEKDMTYATFNIHFSLHFLDDFFELLPELEEFLINVKERKAYMLRNSLFYSSTDMRMIVSNIVRSKFSGKVKKLLTDLKVIELMLLVADVLIQNEERTDFLISETDKQNIYKAAELMATNIKTPKTIRMLSKDCGINENKLKKGFKTIFQRTIFEYITELRMERAHQLLLHSETTVADVTFECGYKNVSNFSAAFKKYYGYSPVFLRRR